MQFSIDALSREHRAIEAMLDALLAAVAEGTVDGQAFRTARGLCGRHFEREEHFLAWLDARDAALAAKLRAQHSEALETADRLEEALVAGHSSDAIYLARRFLAIAQHNIIEEERDVFPLCTVRRLLAE